MRNIMEHSSVHSSLKSKRRGHHGEIRNLLSWLRLGRGQISILIMLPILSIAAAIITGALVQSDFRAQTKLLVPTGYEHAYRPIVGNRMTVSPWKHEVAINAEREILNARSLKIDVVKELGPGTILSVNEGLEVDPTNTLKERVKTLLRSLGLKRPRVSQFEKAIVYLNKELEISTVIDSNVIHLYFKHKNRDTAVRVLKVFLKVYLEQRSKLYAPPNLGTLESVLRRQHEVVDSAQRRLMTYKAQHEIPDKVAIETLQEELRNSRRRLQTTRDKIEDVRLERTLADARWTTVRLIEPPFAPQTPASLPPLVRIFLAGALGLLAAVLLIIGYQQIAFRSSTAQFEPGDLSTSFAQELRKS